MTCNSQHLRLRLDLFFHMIDTYLVIGILVKSQKITPGSPGIRHSYHIFKIFVEGSLHCLLHQVQSQ